MSLAEIKEELRHLSVAERKEVALALIALEKSSEIHTATSFAEAKAYVFENYGDLLQRLGTASAEPRVRKAQPTDADVPAALDAVFEKHHDVLRRLAQ